MSASRLAGLVFAALWPLAAAAQLVVRENDTPHAANPADQVPYPAGAGNCNNTIADIGARAALRAIDTCPDTFFESHEAYVRYAQEAILLIAVPGATEAAGALALDKARENALFCISGALIDESGASAADKAFMKNLVFEAKEINDRVELAGKLGQLKKALVEKGRAGYLEDGELRAFVKTLDVTLQERYEGRTTDLKLFGAGRARNETPESRARDATEQARALGRECRYGEAETGLAQAQAAHLAYLADLRANVTKTKHLRYCIERDARQQPIDELDPASPFLRHSLESADADVAEAQRLDAEETRLIGQLADLAQSIHARRNDVEVLRQSAERRLQSARDAAGNCEFDRAASALDTLNTETLECALQLDAQRRARDELQEKIGEMQRDFGTVDAEFSRAIATPFDQIGSCGELSIFADTIDKLPGKCRTIVGVDAKIAALRERARACAEFKTAARNGGPGAPGGGSAPGVLFGQVTVTPMKNEDHGGGSYIRSTYAATTNTFELVDRGNGRQVKIVWSYAGVPTSLSPGQHVVITVTGGVVSETPKGAGDGFSLSGVVGVYGDIKVNAAQQADRGHPTGTYDFVVNENPRTVEIDLGGYPMGTGAVWKYSKDAPPMRAPEPDTRSVAPTGLTARALPYEE